MTGGPIFSVNFACNCTFRKLQTRQKFHLKAEMFSFYSKYFVYRELRRAPQKLSFCFKWLKCFFFFVMFIKLSANVKEMEEKTTKGRKENYIAGVSFFNEQDMVASLNLNR